MNKTVPEIQKQSLPTTSDKCLVCAREIASEMVVHHDELSSFRIMCQLFKILKISPSVCRVLLVNSTPTILYCESCEQTISRCLKISQEIELLRNSMEELTSKIKEGFIEGYYCRSDIHENCTANADIRKTLVQCWTTCQVRVSKFSENSLRVLAQSAFQQNSNNNKVTDEMEKNEGSESPMNIIEVESSSDKFKNRIEDNSEAPSDANDNLINLPLTLARNDFDCIEDEECFDAPSSPPPTLSDCETENSNVDPLIIVINSEEFADTGIDTPNIPYQTKPKDCENRNEAVAITDTALDSNKTLPSQDTNNVPLISRMSLRAQPRKQILTYTISDSDEDERENDSKSGLDFSPEPESDTEMFSSSAQKRNKMMNKTWSFKSVRRRKGTCLPPVSTIDSDQQQKEFGYYCKTCSKGYYKRQYLDLHEQRHHQVKSSGDKEYPCRIYARGPIEYFECFYCDKVYRSQDYKVELGSEKLRIHCDQSDCNKTFSNFLIFSYHHDRTCLEKLRLLSEDSENDRGKQGIQRTYFSRSTSKDVDVSHDSGHSADADAAEARTTQTKQREAYRASYPIKCTKCYCRFKHKTSLEIHITKNHQKVSCPECNETFSSSRVAYLHQIRVHGNALKMAWNAEGLLESFKCVYCQKTFVSDDYSVTDSSTNPPTIFFKTSLSRIKTWKTLPDFKSFYWYHRRYCYLRPQVVEKGEDLQVPRNQIIDSRQSDETTGPSNATTSNERILELKCEFCKRKYHQFRSYLAHIKTHRGELNHPCPHCGKKFVDTFSLNLHCQNAHSVKPQFSSLKDTFACSYCRKAYAVEFVISVDGNKVFPCNFGGCTYQSPSPDLFGKHHYTHHALDVNRVYKCMVCKDFVRSRECSSVTQTGEVIFKCNLTTDCDKVYKNFKTLIAHHRSHHGDCFKGHENLECKTCKRKFSTKDTLDNHEITAHTKEYKYYCEICGMGRPSKAKLKSHLRSHSKDRPFKCEQCPKTFKKTHELKYHMNKHTGDRPYVCEFCGKTFHAVNNLCMHKKNCHKDQMNQQNKCTSE